MIFVGTDVPDAAVEAKGPPEILARDLMHVCSTEVRRQAGALASLDASLGQILELLSSACNQGQPKLRLPKEVIVELQRADHLRQEMDGVANLLALLVLAESMLQPIPSNTVRSSTPLVAQQARFLSASCSVSPQLSEEKD